MWSCNSPAVGVTSSAVTKMSSLNITLMVPDNHVLFSDDLPITISGPRDDVADAADSWSVSVFCVERCGRSAGETAEDSSEDTLIASTTVRRRTGSGYLDEGSSPGQNTWIATIPCEDIGIAGGYVARLMERLSNGSFVGEFQLSCIRMSTNKRYSFHC